MASTIQFYQDFRIYTCHGCACRNMRASGKAGISFPYIKLPSRLARQGTLSSGMLNVKRRTLRPVSFRGNIFPCQAFLTPQVVDSISNLQAATLALKSSWNNLGAAPWILKLIPAVGVVIFAAWGLVPIMRFTRSFIFQQSDNSWKRSNINYVTTSYIQPLLLWTGVTLICGSLDSLATPTLASQAIKQRLLTFVRSLSTVLAFAYCLSSLIQLAQKFFMDTTSDSNDARNMGFSFVGKAVYTAVWVAAVSFFMELLGFSTQKWLTAGGLGTVLITLAGREILTNFLSSVMIHATRPFVLNEWIQTKIEGYEVSGTVEHVGWWSPTVIRGDDREAVHIPNHKFNVTVVRNLSQKTHWRIKTYLSISHMDVNKISSIVADMRKVIAKNPQVEQQKLHRRVFLENIDPENQALNILISCFVKTSHFEEYLCVKEAILLDLLRVVSHHRARLATPIRTVQKVYSDADLDGIPFADSFFTRSRPPKSPYLLIEPSYKVSDAKSRTVSPTRQKGSTEDKGAKSDPSSPLETKDSRPLDTPDAKNEDIPVEAVNLESRGSYQDNEPQRPGESFGNPKKGTIGFSSEVNAQGGTQKRPSTANAVSPDERNSSGVSGLQMRQEIEKPGAVSSSAGRPPLEGNIVLEVALEGSKRTLPIEDEVVSSSSTAESKESKTSQAPPIQST